MVLLLKFLVQFSNIQKLVRDIKETLVYMNNIGPRLTLHTCHCLCKYKSFNVRLDRFIANMLLLFLGQYLYHSAFHSRQS